MEPLPKERSDVVELVPQRDRRRAASMEPLPKERSDDDGPYQGRAPADGLNGAAPEGAERPSHQGTGASMSERRPQWSRSRRSGATVHVLVPDQAVTRASMEPLPKERSDGTSLLSDPAHSSRCLNGAAPEGAERRAGSLADLPVVRASMEPLPKERSDAPDGSTPDRRRRAASMEPLPKERSDDCGHERGRGAERASMEPLPKERSDGFDSIIRRVELRDASMEPLPKERSDAALACTRSAKACGLNGAAPEGAERRLAKNEPSDLQERDLQRAPSSQPTFSCLCAVVKMRNPAADLGASAPRCLSLHLSARAVRR